MEIETPIALVIGGISKKDTQSEVMRGDDVRETKTPEYSKMIICGSNMIKFMKRYVIVNVGRWKNV